MRLFSRAAPIEKKENPTGAAILIENNGRRRSRGLKEYYDEGYCQNIIIFRCIDQIGSAMASVEIEVHDKNGTVLENHPALKLLKKPNPTQSYGEFIKQAVADYKTAGNLFVTRFPDNGQATELWIQSPLKMTVTPGQYGIPLKYSYEGAKKFDFMVNQVDGSCACLHIKTYNPNDPFVGLSPLSHVALAADVHNNGLVWNSSLLKNGARPSGLVNFPGNPDNTVLSRANEYFKKAMQGPRNAGGIPMLTGGAQWTPMSENAKDMDFLNLMKEMSKYISSALGVPLPLVDNDASSYNNIEQAKELLWTDTVMPLLRRFLEALSAWLLPAYGEGLKFSFNEDSIPALEGLRAKRFERMAKLVEKGLLSIDEAREAIGYSPRGGVADELLVSGTLMPVSSLTDAPGDTSMPDNQPPDPDSSQEPDAQQIMKALGYDETAMKALVSEIYGQR